MMPSDIFHHLTDTACSARMYLKPRSVDAVAEPERPLGRTHGDGQDGRGAKPRFTAPGVATRARAAESRVWGFEAVDRIETITVPDRSGGGECSAMAPRWAHVTTALQQQWHRQERHAAAQLASLTRVGGGRPRDTAAIQVRPSSTATPGEV